MTLKRKVQAFDGSLLKKKSKKSTDSQRRFQFKKKREKYIDLDLNFDKAKTWMLTEAKKSELELWWSMNDVTRANKSHQPTLADLRSATKATFNDLEKNVYPFQIHPIDFVSIAQHQRAGYMISFPRRHHERELELRLHIINSKADLVVQLSRFVERRRIVSYCQTVAKVVDETVFAKREYMYEGTGGRGVDYEMFPTSIPVYQLKKSLNLDLGNGCTYRLNCKVWRDRFVPDIDKICFVDGSAPIRWTAETSIPLAGFGIEWHLGKTLVLFYLPDIPLCIQEIINQYAFVD